MLMSACAASIATSSASSMLSMSPSICPTMELRTTGWPTPVYSRLMTVAESPWLSSIPTPTKSSSSATTRYLYGSGPTCSCSSWYSMMSSKVPAGVAMPSSPQEALSTQGSSSVHHPRASMSSSPSHDAGFSQLTIPPGQTM